MIKFDFLIFHFINGLANRFWLFDWLGVFLAKYLAYFLVLAAIWFFVKQKNWRDRIYFLSLAGLSAILSRGIITEAIRFFYYRPRPFLELNIQPLINHSAISSFPSGHAAFFFALALTIFYFNKKWGTWFLVLALLMGLARIFVGVHWPLDIIGGAAIGLASAFFIRKVLPQGSKIKIKDVPLN